MLVPGQAPGDVTTKCLTGILLVTRLVGAACLLALFFATQFVDACTLHLAGVRVSAVEVLIMVGTLNQSIRVVCASVSVWRMVPLPRRDRSSSQTAESLDLFSSVVHHVPWTSETFDIALCVPGGRQSQVQS